MTAMTIGTLARRANVGVETVRFYERRGLIARPPRPAAGGFRHYPEETVGRIRFVRQAQELGFTLSEIGELLALRADPEGDCADVRESAIAKLQDVESKIARLQRIGAALTAVIAACPGRGALTSCSILEALKAEEKAAAE